MSAGRLAIAAGLCLAAAGSGFGATRYVNATNAAPSAPYATPGSAATNIQQAIDASTSGDEIDVAAGSDRGVLFRRVWVRVHRAFVGEFHVDVDEANACGLTTGEVVRLCV